MTQTSPPQPPEDENKLIAERREKLTAIRQQGGVAFPNDFKPKHHALDLVRKYGEIPNEELEPQGIVVSLGGRMMLKRMMGKASFATLQDSTSRLQLFVTKDALGDEVYAAFKHWDLGDILGAEGTLFRTKTGELSVRVTTLRLLTKSLRPLPDKFHGMADQEQKYRQRYVDLITDEEARARFVARSKALGSIRHYMIEHGFMEVETPMLHPIPGGAANLRSRSALRVNNGDVMRDATLAGLGIALLPTFVVGATVRAGALSVIEIGVEAEVEFIYLAHPEGRRPSAKLRAVADCLRAAFGDPPYWDLTTLPATAVTP
jgi:lysyl-tRNA synthetase class II